MAWNWRNYGAKKIQNRINKGFKRIYHQTVNLLSSTSMVRIHPLPPDYVPDFTVRHIFLSIHAGLRAFFRFKKGLVSHYCHPRF